MIVIIYIDLDFCGNFDSKSVLKKNLYHFKDHGLAKKDVFSSENDIWKSYKCWVLCYSTKYVFLEKSKISGSQKNSKNCFSIVSICS